MRDVDIRLLSDDGREPLVTEDTANAVFENVTGA
jgi:hypothetical protein